MTNYIKWTGITLINLLIAGCLTVWVALVAQGGYVWAAPRPNMTQKDWQGEAIADFFHAMPIVIVFTLVSFGLNYGLYRLLWRNSNLWERNSKAKRFALCFSASLALWLLFVGASASVTLYHNPLPYDIF